MVDLQDTKICTKCKKLLPLSAFGIQNHLPDKHARRCKTCMQAYNKERYYKNWAENRAQRNVAQSLRYWKNPERAKKYARDSRKALRLYTIAIYGGKCACCGELEESFLTIDHIHGNGNEHRRKVGNNSVSVLQDIRRQGYPKDLYQILCFNCNRSKYVLGICAHNKNK